MLVRIGADWCVLVASFRNFDGVLWAVYKATDFELKLIKFADIEECKQTGGGI